MHIIWFMTALGALTASSSNGFFLGWDAENVPPWILRDGHEFFTSIVVDHSTAAAIEADLTSFWLVGRRTQSTYQAYKREKPLEQFSFFRKWLTHEFRQYRYASDAIYLECDLTRAIREQKRGYKTAYADEKITVGSSDDDIHKN
ncbi:hypothetical protein AAVH_18817 [Aphelenchoides avenae]|nr:hypothetical protein AAVH_18817 [Aphelenchus avenae]